MARHLGVALAMLGSVQPGITQLRTVAKMYSEAIAGVMLLVFKLEAKHVLRDCYRQ